MAKAAQAPTMEALRARREDILRVASAHGVRNVRVFGSVARGESGSGSDVDLLVDGSGRLSTFGQAALQSELEDLLGCPVHVTTTAGLRPAREHIREEIEGEAVAL